MRRLALIGLFVHPVNYESVYRIGETKTRPLSGGGQEPDKADMQLKLTTVNGLRIEVAWDDYELYSL